MSRLANSMGDMFCGCGAPPTGTVRGIRQTPKNGIRWTSAKSDKAWDHSHPWVVALDRPVTPSSPRGASCSLDDEFADLPAMVEHAMKRQMSDKTVAKSSVATRLTLLTRPDDVLVDATLKVFVPSKKSPNPRAQ